MTATIKMSAKKLIGIIADDKKHDYALVSPGYACTRSLVKKILSLTMGEHMYVLLIRVR